MVADSAWTCFDDVCGDAGAWTASLGTSLLEESLVLA